MATMKKVWLLLAALLVLGSFAVSVSAVEEPVAPTTLNNYRNETFNPANYVPQWLDAFAGNITQIGIYAIVQTNAWQGYWGNISGTITLDDGNNNTFYNWSSAEPRGEVYATLNTSVVWEDVQCFDFVGSGANWYTIESYYNIQAQDQDGVNETYVYTNHDPFQVGFHTLANCPTTYIFRDDTSQTSDFQNVLLYDPNNPVNGWIYATIIENRSTTTGSPPDLTCFNGEFCDFQLLVNEDGHGTDVATTTYYFWVELM